MKTPYALFAQMLEYPTSHLFEQVAVSLHLFDRVEMKDLLTSFCNWVDKTPLEEMEETYTSTFDLKPVCYPYLGYQFFGESYKRGAFMAKLKEEYQREGFSEGNELPDHMAVVLRFLSVLQDEERCNVLIKDGLIPVLNKMRGFFKDGENPYSHVIDALFLFLNGVSNPVPEDEPVKGGV